MRSFKCFSLLILWFCLASCGQDQAKVQTDKLVTLGEELGFDLFAQESVAMINVDACSSCGNAIKDFLKINETNNKLMVILSSQSEKKCRFMVEGFEHMNILFDTKQRAFKHFKLLDMQPVIYYKGETDYEKSEYLLSEFAGVWVDNQFDQ